MKRILVVGSINVDIGINTDVFPQTGETIKGFNFTETLGGKGCNQAIAANNFGSDVAMCACVGDDSQGKEIKNLLKDKGLNVENVLNIKDKQTGVAMIVRSQNDNSIIIHSGANDCVNESMVVSAIERFKPSMLILQYEIPMSAVAASIEYASSKGISVVVNPAPAQIISDELMSKIDFFVLNQSETKTIVGIYPDSFGDCQLAAKELMNKGVKNVIITLGKDGCYYKNKDLSGVINGIETKVMDTTGAGDAFVGVLCASMIESNDLVLSLQRANKAGSIVCTRLGASEIMPMRNELIGN